MLDFLRTRWAQGTRTSPFPDGDPGFPERFRGRPLLDPLRCDGGCQECAARVPSDVLIVGSDGRALLDTGACLFSPEEASRCQHGAVSYSVDHRLAARSRQDLVTPTGELPVIAALESKTRALFGRSLRLRSVAAGSCNGCEAELVALGNVVFDMARFGVQFVASPRHADGLVLTGAVSRNMRDAVYRVYEAIPEPKLVIAVGACAINGGPFRGSPEVDDGVPADLPVDLWIPGCPPHPLTVLDGLLRLLGRLEGAIAS
ncbi:MAG TPA: NADH-quinone oxidoreductase subunit NuoB [Gemmatimonadales bacterium]|nr:NADH-quinone oxidoreductase subunit NuoB [Gemmatimonadales bacterium]